MKNSNNKYGCPYDFVREKNKNNRRNSIVEVYSYPQQLRLCVKCRDRCHHTYSHHSLKNLTNPKPRLAGVHTLTYIHIPVHTH